MIRIVALALLLVAAPVMAQPTTTAKQEAERLYETGTQHYNLGEYDKAIAIYKDAYRTFPNPYFLYNIAQSYRRAGELQQALSFYKSFLNALPDPPNRAEVDDRIRELEAALQSQAQANSASPTAPVSPEGPRVPPPAEAVAHLPKRAATAPTPAPLTVPLQAEPRDDASHPIYKRWWFWVGIGVVAAGATSIAVMSGGDDTPASDLGNYPVLRTR